MLVVVYAINKFKQQITSYSVFVHTYHTTIRYIMKKPIVGGILVRWLLLLYDFNITIVDKPSKTSVVEIFL
jgi:hypothetical protein